VSYERELAAARRIAAEAGALALRYRAEGVRAEDKPDDSPVTAADRACEALIVAALDREFPEDGLLGEEGAARESRNGRRWIIDPIDGTRDFVRGNRLWCHLLALEEADQVVVGVAHFPALAETYWATRGGGAWRDGARLCASSISDPARAVACLNQIQHVPHRPLADKFWPLTSQFWAVRCLGGAQDAMMVCAGQADFWLEASLKPWDLAAIRIMAAESGAVYLDYAGGDSIYQGGAILCAPGLAGLARWYLGLEEARPLQ
jgi:fructose-1,6-bisphosphatase/inositol monophosphatase family enzyme